MAKPSRTERLLALALVLLNSSRALSREEIRTAVRDYPADATDAAFERMFERDKDELRAMGMPIETVTIEGVSRYQLDRSKLFLPPIEATEDERWALAVAARVWQEATWGHASRHALRKLELVGGFETESALPVTVTVPVNSGVLTALLQACNERREVSFNYRTGESTTTQRRRLQPWGVVSSRTFWYLVGYDLDRADTRVFRTSRISGDINVGKKQDCFEIPADLDLRRIVTSTFPPSETVTVRLKADPKRAATLRALAGGDDQPEFTITDASPEWIVSEILRAADAVEVLEPASTRTDVIEKLQLLEHLEAATASDAERTQLKKASERASAASIETTVDQLGRLLTIVPWLKANPGVTYQQAAAHFGVDQARLQRDLELAICTEFGPHLSTLDIDMWGSTLSIRETQGIDQPLSFTQSEAISLLIALDLLTQLPGRINIDAVASIADKLRAATGTAAHLTDHLVMDAAVRGSSDLSDTLTAIDRALTERRSLELEYRGGASDTISRRIVHPISTFTTNGTSYLHALCTTADALRLFRIDRIVSIAVTDQPLELPEEMRTSVPALKPSGTVTIVELDESLAWWADQTPGTTQLSAGGRLLVQLDVADPQWAVRTVLGFAGRMRVVSPTDLATAVRERAAAALALYSE